VVGRVKMYVTIAAARAIIATCPHVLLTSEEACDGEPDHDRCSGDNLCLTWDAKSRPIVPQHRPETRVGHQPLIHPVVRAEDENAAMITLMVVGSNGTKTPTDADSQDHAV
jgi:hypothetical protein